MNGRGGFSTLSTIEADPSWRSRSQLPVRGCQQAFLGQPPDMRVVQAPPWLRDTKADAEEKRFVLYRLDLLLRRQPDGAPLRKDLHDGMLAQPA